MYSFRCCCCFFQLPLLVVVVMVVVSDAFEFDRGTKEHVIVPRMPWLLLPLLP